MLHAAAAQGRELDAFVVRKDEKAHGLQRRIEGPDVAGRRVLAVEDTSTTGGSVLTAVEALREAGAEVVGVAVIVDRSTGRPGAGRGRRLRLPLRVRARRAWTLPQRAEAQPEAQCLGDLGDLAPRPGPGGTRCRSG